jgi:hypothetical protein
MCYSTLTIPQLTSKLTSKLTALKDLASAHQKLIHYYMMLPIKTAITDADLFEKASNLPSTPTNVSAQPQTFHVHDATNLLWRAKSQATELRIWADFNLDKLFYLKPEIPSNPYLLGPYVNAKESELMQWVRKDLEDTIILFGKRRCQDAMALQAKPQIRLYLQGTLTDVLKLVPVLFQFGEDG